MFKKFFTVAALATFSGAAFAQTAGYFSSLKTTSTATIGNTLYVKANGVDLINAYNTGYNSVYPVFFVDRDGFVGTRGLRVSEAAPGVGGGAKLSVTYGGNAFKFSTSSPYNKYYTISFLAKDYVFDVNSSAGTMTINCPVTCKKSFDVVSLNANDIKTNDITVDMPNAADYVFEDNYDLKSLSEVESFVKENKHLPGMPSASDFAKNGMSVAEISNKLLEKVEELTLHMIQLEKENQSLRAEVENLKK